jgi:hypothetical protein
MAVYGIEICVPSVPQTVLGEPPWVSSRKTVLPRVPVGQFKRAAHDGGRRRTIGDGGVDCGEREQLDGLRDVLVARPVHRLKPAQAVILQGRHARVDAAGLLDGDVLVGRRENVVTEVEDGEVARGILLEVVDADLCAVCLIQRRRVADLHTCARPVLTKASSRSASARR